MSTISQTIPNYVLGISEQPDQLKTPGQVRDLVNAIPDVTLMCGKRPGSEVINEIGNLDAALEQKWFSIENSEFEQYLGRLSTDGTVEVNRLVDSSDPFLRIKTNGSLMTNGTYYDLASTTNGDGTGLTADVIVAGRVVTIAYIRDFGQNYKTGDEVNITVGTDNIVFYYFRCAQFVHDKHNSSGVRLFGTGYTAGTKDTTSENGSGLTVDIGVDTSGNVTSATIVNPGDGNYQSNDEITVDEPGATTAHILIYKTGEAGEGMLVTYEGNAKSYMANSEPATKMKHLTIDDFTYFVNRDKAVTMDTQRSPAFGNKGFVNIINLSANKRYTFNIIEKDTANNTTNNYEISQKDTTGTNPTYIRKQTSNSPTDVKSEVLLEWINMVHKKDASWTVHAVEDLDVEFTGATDVVTSTANTTINLSAYKFKVLGNGLLITSDTKEFSLQTADTQLMTVFTNSIQNISLLPTQCSHGYKALVANSDTVDDDYYVQFVGRDGQDGIGYWEETTGSNILTTIDKDTMPHQMRRNANATFTISAIDYNKRVVGDDVTNKPPSFVGGYTPEGEEIAIGNKYINNIVSYRNRLGFLSGDNVILSRPEDFFNFFNKTSLTISAEDPIDIAVSDTQPATLYDSIESNVGLVLFSRNQQFLMSTDGDALSPATVRATFLSAYLYNENVSPINLGTTQAFVKDDGRNTQFFEMQQQRRDGEPQLLELSKIISNRLPSGINILSNARGSGTILMSKKGSLELWGHRYFNTGSERVQSSWFRFEMPDKIYYHCIIRDVIYTVQKLNSELTIQKMDLKRYDDSRTYANDPHKYRVHLDNRITIHNAGEDVEVSDFPYTLVNTNTIDYFHEDSGQYGSLTVANDQISLNTSLQQGDIHFGKNYEMEVSFPTIFPTQDGAQQTRADVTGSLTLHRIKLSCGQIGKFDVFMKRKGKNDLTLGFEATEADSFTLDDQPFLPDRIVTVPVYERNTNTFISFRSNYPTPATLISMTWEGDYVNRLYRRA